MKDRFSEHSSLYAAFRPRYPQELYDFIFGHVRSFDMAWDAATGNGQAASVLAGSFEKVVATDISAKQLEHAIRLPNVDYVLAGETTVLADHSVDLITVAQAIHWLDRHKFYLEVRRVAKPGAVVAVWVYGLLKASPAIDPLIEHFYTRVVGPYWDPERRLIDEQLKTIEFPFEEIKSPVFSMTYEWTPAELEGYLNTWSATQNYIIANRVNPVTKLMAEVSEVHAASRLKVHFPLFLRLGVLR